MFYNCARNLKIDLKVKQILVPVPDPLKDMLISAFFPAKIATRSHGKQVAFNICELCSRFLER